MTLGQVELTDAQAVVAGRVAAATERLRSMASASVEDAVANLSTLGFERPWAAEVTPLFAGNESSLAHVFQFGVMFLGSASEDRAVSAIWDPFLDAGLLVEWEVRLLDVKARSYLFATGEELRGEPRPGDHRVPSWFAASAGLPENALLESCDASPRAFEKRFPLGVAPPCSTPWWIAGDRRAEELEIVNDRVIFRLAHTSESLTPEARQSLDRAVRRVLDPIGRGSLDDLLSAIAAGADPAAAEQALDLPPEIRSTLVPHFCRNSAGSALVFLGSSLMPRLFFTVRANLDAEVRVQEFRQFAFAGADD